MLVCSFSKSKVLYTLHLTKIILLSPLFVTGSIQKYFTNMLMQVHYYCSCYFSSFSYSLPVDIDPKSQLNRKPFELDKVEVRGTHLCLVLVLVLVLYFNLVKLIVNLVLWFVPKVNNQSSTLLLNHTIVGVLLPSLSYLNDAIVCLVAAEKNSTHKSLMADIAPLMMWHFCRFLLYRNEGW